ncbi:MAG: signal peptidase I [Nitrososphaerales archaeon]|jgi:signal peptidase
MTSRGRIGLVVGVVILAILLGLPFFAGTKTYPLAVVQGNSMYPKLQNGALVLFAAPSGPIQNGSIIVFVQGSTGVSALDAFLKPIVIHRVVSVGQEPNGLTDYQTKGDDNQQPDPFITDSTSVLGVPVLVIPLAGLPVLFLQSSYGMVTVIALLCIFFFSSFDTKEAAENEKKRFIAVFARQSLNGKMSMSQFERLKLAVEYYDDMPTAMLTDPVLLSAIDWMKAGGLSTNWKEEKVSCPTCNTESLRISNDGRFFLVCPGCSERRPSPSES